MQSALHQLGVKLSSLIRTETRVADGSGRPHAFEFSPVLGGRRKRRDFKRLRWWAGDLDSRPEEGRFPARSLRSLGIFSLPKRSCHISCITCVPRSEGRRQEPSLAPECLSGEDQLFAM